MSFSINMKDMFNLFYRRAGETSDDESIISDPIRSQSSSTNNKKGGVKRRVRVLGKLKSDQHEV